ncbi:MAG TPA: M12 family metallo-peptidase, partial [Candidatus Polarisedimenticolia bacterium]|nr:M12 family metallo-peptidase [Candidatus Polarisedimenticolia bacterium]
MKASSALPCLIVACLSLPGAAGAGERPEKSPFQAVAQDGRFLRMAWNEADLRAVAEGPFRVRGFPLRDDLEVDLDLERFTVTGPGTRFVVGRRGAPDDALDFDPAAVLLLRGTVRGRPGSHLFMALQNGRASGVIDLGAGGGRYRIASQDAAGATLPPGTLAVFRMEETAAALPPGVPLCGAGEGGEAAPATSGERSPLPLPVQPPRPGLRQLELAVDTDHEYFGLFGDLDAAAAYLVALYGAVSDIYMRDLNTRVELTFARLWDNPDDLFNDVDPSPLRDFHDYWEANMSHVQRDAAQLLSGRRDYPFGGQAWVGSLCGFLGYSVVGYAMGFFPDPSAPSSYHYDITITAHELGHSAGTHHTHDFPNNVDSCNNVSTPRQRGTIMSYCGETGSGMNANIDLYFHTRIRDNIAAHLAGATCVADDCNANSVADTLDIDLGTSLDVDGNGVPDECEDCNGNAVPDRVEGLPDLNANGISDACEPDCNRNSRPDDVDIADRRSSDRFGNGVPDECEPDCNANGVSDYTEIQAAMSLDIDRDARIDACQDCDHDSRTDSQTLIGAHGAWIASGLEQSPVRRFHGMSGVLELASEPLPASLVSRGQDLIITPRRQVLVSSAGDHRVLRFNASGAYLDDLARPGAGGLRYPTGLLRRGDGAILVASRDSDSVLAFREDSGAFLGVLVAPGSGGLIAPFGLALGPNRHLFVTSAANEVLEYHPTTGAFIRALVAADANGGLDQPRGLVFKPDGNLLVASFGNDELLEFDGRTGAPRGPWARVGTATRITRTSPWGVRIGPNGNVFMVRTGEEYGSGSDGSHDHGGDTGEDDPPALHRTNAQIYEFDVRNGRFVRTYI